MNNEVERWDFIRDLLLRTPNTTRFAVEHSCGILGWGNTIRGIFNSVALAIVLGRRLIFTSPIYHRMFDFPFKELIPSKFQDIQAFDSRKEFFDYSLHARNPGSFANFQKNLSHLDASYYGKPVLCAALCGGVRELFIDNNHLEFLIPKFVSCSKRYDEPFNMPDHMLNIPFFYFLFSKPSKTMIDALSKIRTSVHLPPLPRELEPNPGQWGLRTPGYYIFALHFRNQPLGFESSAVELNTENLIASRQNLLEYFWTAADRFASEARNIADCRNETLLIYFATDDTFNLRPIAEERLSQHGRVVFGLSDDEVGHMYPQWTEKEDTKSGLPPDKKHMQKNVSAEANLVHATMGIAEWWVLANSNWLVAHIGSSFGETAAAWGLGPRGAMERLDFVYYEFSQTSYRRQWHTDSCTPVIPEAGDKQCQSQRSCDSDNSIFC